MPAPRIAILGVILESNRQAAVATQADFESHYFLEGQSIVDEARSRNSVIAQEVRAFVRMMDSTGPWEPIPLVLTGCHPSGPVDADAFREFMSNIVERLTRAGPVDAVYIANHGAMIATDSHDPDGDLFAAIRNTVGPDVPIIVTLDLHANISDEMATNADAIVGYRTNPHVDMIERGEEAAKIIRLTLSKNADPQLYMVRLPLTPSSVSLLTADKPYGTLIDFAQRRKSEYAGVILNVSIFGGFVFSDTPYNGVAICVTARNAHAAAKELAEELAAQGWEDRALFQRSLLPIEDAIDLIRTKKRNPLIFSDAGDNPGGGGSGRTTEFLMTLINSEPEGVYYGSFYDPPLAKAAHKAGQGNKFKAEFNTDPGEPADKHFRTEAEVVALHSGDVIGRLGLLAGRQLHLGPSAALKIGGIIVIVISDRSQTADPMFFEMFGLDIADAHTVIVKSRGHFRSGFRPWFPPERVKEVDTDGLTSPVLERRQWHYLPRPVYPLDKDVEWSP